MNRNDSEVNQIELKQVNMQRDNRKIKLYKWGQSESKRINLKQFEASAETSEIESEASQQQVGSETEVS